MAVIKNGDLWLRPIAISDAAAACWLCNDIEIARNTARIPNPYSFHQAIDFIRYAQAAWANGGERVFAICRGHKMIGCAGLMPVTETTVELGYWVGRPFRGAKVAQQAGAKLCDFAFRELRSSLVTANYFVDNPASGHVLAAIGFQPTGANIEIYSIGRNARVAAIAMAMTRNDRKTLLLKE